MKTTEIIDMVVYCTGLVVWVGLFGGLVAWSVKGVVDWRASRAAKRAKPLSAWTAEDFRKRGLM